jgi:hypothetical protein
LGVLLHRQGRQRSPAGENDDKIDDNGKDRMLDEDVCE